MEKLLSYRNRLLRLMNWVADDITELNNENIVVNSLNDYLWELNEALKEVDEVIEKEKMIKNE